MRRQDTGDRRRAAADGGETFCAACGELYDASRDECPECGLPKDGSPGDDGPDAASEPENSSPSQSERSVGESNTVVSGRSTDAELREPDRDGSDGQVAEKAVTGDAGDTDGSDTNDQDTPAPRSAQTEPAQTDPVHTEPGPDEEYCSSCGEILSKGADACPHCGTELNPSDPDNKKNPIVAGVLSLVIPGGGHVYALDIQRGAKVFLAFIGAWVLTAASAGIGGLAVIAVIGIWLWGSYDAYSRTAELWT